MLTLHGLTDQAQAYAEHGLGQLRAADDPDRHVVTEMTERSLVNALLLAGQVPDAGRLVRMSVRSDQRGRGLGKQLVRALIDEARTRGMMRVVCETTDDWHDAIGLYRACGFAEVGRWDGDAHFELNLLPVPA